MQKSGFDGVLLKNKEKLKQINLVISKLEGAKTVNVKANSFKYYLPLRIPIEVTLYDYYNPQQKISDGWYYTTKAEIIGYCWPNINAPNRDENSRIIDGCLLFVQDKRFRNWFEENKNQFGETKTSTTRKNGKKFITEFYLIFEEWIDKIPTGCFQNIPKSIFQEYYAQGIQDQQQSGQQTLF